MSHSSEPRRAYCAARLGPPAFSRCVLSFRRRRRRRAGGATLARARAKSPPRSRPQSMAGPFVGRPELSTSCARACATRSRRCRHLTSSPIGFPPTRRAGGKGKGKCKRKRKTPLPARPAPRQLESSGSQPGPLERRAGPRLQLRPAAQQLACEMSLGLRAASRRPGLCRPMKRAGINFRRPPPPGFCLVAAAVVVR